MRQAVRRVVAISVLNGATHAARQAVHENAYVAVLRCRALWRLLPDAVAARRAACRALWRQGVTGPNNKQQSFRLH